MDKRARACCRHSLRQLTTSPRLWALLILFILCFDRYLSPIRALLVDENIQISGMALIVYLLNDSWISVMAALGLLILLFDVPKQDASQKYLLLRSGRKAWARGQLYYILTTTVLYLLALCLITLAWMGPWLDWTLGWSQAIEEFVNGAYEVYDSMLNYDPWIMRAYTPLSALAVEGLLHYVCFVMLGIFMCLINAAVGSKAGFIAAAAPVLVDTVLTEYFSSHVYYYSPLTLTRLSCLDLGDDMGNPPVVYAFAVLILLSIVLGALFVHIYGRKEVHQ